MEREKLHEVATLFFWCFFSDDCKRRRAAFFMWRQSSLKKRKPARQGLLRFAEAMPVLSVIAFICSHLPFFVQVI
ncbi:MAG: hypothetical protein EOO08_03015 [Chitinophagaceae bacterium]|nr:MAG: hypothetical protein EOO08_03015 [Chitinophagaceae bacterium]